MLSYFLNINCTIASFIPSAPTPRPSGISTFSPGTNRDLTFPYLSSPHPPEVCAEILFPSLPLALCTLRPKSVSQLFCDQLLPHSFAKHPGVVRLSNQKSLSIASPVTPLFVTLTHSAPVTPLFVTDSPKTTGGGRGQPFFQKSPTPTPALRRREPLALLHGLPAQKTLPLSRTRTYRIFITSPCATTTLHFTV